MQRRGRRTAAAVVVSVCGGGWPRAARIRVSIWPTSATKTYLANRSKLAAVGIVEHAVLLGAPVSVDRVKFRTARSVVAGRFVNGHSGTDWLLGLCTRCAPDLTPGPACLYRRVHLCSARRGPCPEDRICVAWCCQDRGCAADVTMPSPAGGLVQPLVPAERRVSPLRLGGQVCSP